MDSFNTQKKNLTDRYIKIEEQTVEQLDKKKLIGEYL